MIKDSFFMGIRFIIVSITALITNVILTRSLSVDDYGNYKLAFSIIGALALFSLPGLNTGVIKATAKNYPYFFKRAIRLSFIGSLLATIALLILSFTMYSHSVVKYILLYASALVPFMFAFNTWQSYYVGAKEFRSFFWITLPISIVEICIIWTITSLTKNIVTIAIAVVIYTTATNLIISSNLLNKVSKSEIDRSKEKEFTIYGFKMSAMGVLGVLSANIEKIILAAVASPNAVALYSVAWMVPKMLREGLRNILNVPSMRFASMNEKDNRLVLKKNLGYLLLIGFCLFLIAYLTLPFVIKLFFGTKYINSIFYSQLLLLTIIVVPANVLIVNVAAYQGSGNSYVKLNIGLSILGLILFFILIPIFKTYGIIISVITVDVLSFIILITWFFMTNKKVI
jgi:O-antigen/teichoic acid export membrane protein